VAGGAAPETRSEAQAHRARCADCEQEYRLAERVEQGFGQLPQLFPLQEPVPQLDRMFGAARTVAALTFDPTQPVELALGCQDFKDMLGDFVSEELPVGTLLDGVEHASACRPCGDQLATLQTLQDSLRTLPDLEPPPRMFEQLMARIDAEEAEAGATALEPGKAKKTATARSKLLPVLG
jgi:hypothetical protein